MIQNATFQAVHQNPVPAALSSYVRWQIAGQTQLRVRGLQRRGAADDDSWVMTFDFGASRIHLTDALGQTLADIPDDALTQFVFCQDPGGNLHFMRWNPYGRPTNVVDPRKLSEALRSRFAGLRAERLVAEDLGRTYAPFSVQIGAPELLQWLRTVSKARTSELAQRLDIVLKTSQPSQVLPMAA